VTVVPRSNGKSKRMRPASCAAIMTSANAVGAVSPNSAEPAQSVLSAPVPLELLYPDRNSIRHSCCVAGALRRWEISLPRTLVASREKNGASAMADEFDRTKNMQNSRVG